MLHAEIIAWGRAKYGKVVDSELARNRTNTIARLLNKRAWESDEECGWMFAMVAKYPREALALVGEVETVGGYPLTREWVVWVAESYKLGLWA